MQKNTYIIILLYYALNLLYASPAMANTFDFDAQVQEAEARRIAIAEQMEASTIFVFGYNEGESYGFGTGFVVADGYILTNGHVTDGFANILVAGNNLPAQRATVIKEINEKWNDFALLKFNHPENLPILHFNNALRRTDRVSAWGYPAVVIQFDTRLDQILTGNFQEVPPLVYTGGEVSSFINNGNAISIVHSALISQGNSGGPLVNARGEVVGINTWKGGSSKEGSIVFAALTAEAAIDFIRSCGVEPLLAKGSMMAMLDEDHTLPREGAEAHIRPQTPPMPDPTHTDNTEAKTDDSPEDMADLLNDIRAIIGSSVITEPQNPQQDVDTSQFSPQMREAYAQAKAGVAQAQAHVGAHLYEGNGAPKNPELGVFWLKKAAAQGHADGQGILGIIQITDFNFKDIPRGLHNLRLAVVKDSSYAMRLAYFLYAGETLGVERNIPESLTAAEIGANAGYPAAIGLLSLLYYKGYTHIDNEDVKALELATMVEHDNIASAHATLAWLYYASNSVTNDMHKAFQYAKKAAEAGVPEGMALLAYMYHDGTTGTVDNDQALFWAKKAADLGNDVGQTFMGQMYCEGTIVPQDLALGVAYLGMATHKGLIAAQNLYSKFYPQLDDWQREKAQGQMTLWREQWGLPILQLPS